MDDFHFSYMTKILKTRGVGHTLCHLLKKDLKAKERRIMETQIFHHSQKLYVIFKQSSKRNQKSFKIL
jgi:type II secretory pathway predicted ATPase ExeA